ncbi:NAD(P)/FAD-dependent oxidoreductase [Saccharopolyspora phatthalungensis]|uniref:3-phenylpropionate/trans-cinnamate dioxygenase ferredoxin reductase subunit n=1 Tax=Saccharopolyspora phatthalungensis TaxID=664693 RepID=A0A840Q7E9_9PSEU|nr:FAD-dependent oxidoreductase [Saccharopolyspora phatthalungensis]MBB5155800.1 3-phenylpropionate/trans-cinnamate dioxygenase ferredoxin reductase subunit [Saccharopolyspora phatthalungensis]
MRAVAIVGASLAGWRAAQELRAQGFEGRIELIGEETHRPYDRPPLSKDFLSGGLGAKDLALAEETDLAEVAATWRLGRRAVALAPSDGVIELDDSTRCQADGVVIATGATPKTLPAIPPGVHTLRTLDDALALRDDLRPGAKAVIVGAGFVGAEVASTCRNLGLDVTVVEALEVPLAPVVGPKLGAVCAALHADHGVRLLCGTGVERLHGEQRVTAVELTDGTVLPADVVVVGIGARPNTDWLHGSGLTVSNGVQCDAGGVTDLPNVVAVGDVASYRTPNGAQRFEHWTTAMEQPATAVRNLLAGRTTANFTSVPYFWSEQYGVRIQFAGHARPTDRIAIVDGAPDDRRFVATFHREDETTGVLAMNNPKLFTKHRRQLIAKPTAPVS